MLPTRGAVAVVMLGLALGQSAHSARATDAEVEATQAAAAPGGRFVLQAHDGRTVTDADFRGSHLLVFFGYTHCPDVCPSSLLTVARVLELLGPNAGSVQPLFVTVDPERDTQKVLAGFVGHFDRRIVGLTGSMSMIERVTQAYRVKFKKVESASRGFYTVDHTATMFHMGPDGEFIRRIPYETSPEQIVEMLRPSLGTGG